MEQLVNQSESQKNSVQFLPIIISVFLTILIVGSGIFWWTNQKQNELRNEITSLNSLVNQLQQTSTTSTEVQSTPISTSLTLSGVTRIFELDKKETGTKLSYYEKLGVGFTYLSYTPNSPVTVTESGSKIDVSGQTIEVFTKDPKITLEQAIENKFLQEYNSADCFVKTYETSEQKLSNYVSAGISFPRTNDLYAPWWQNSDKCPEFYSETNGLVYFLMNKDVPGKFLFVRLGQDSVASDGTPGGGFGWSHSIRILK